MYDNNTGFYKFGQYVDESYIDLKSGSGKYDIEFPISFLSDALAGMTKSELMVIGADSGVGKSEIVNKIAFHNAKKGKNVYMFSLEGDKYDLINRLRYEYYVKYLKKTKNYGMWCSYRDFLINRNLNQEALETVDDMLKNNLETLKVFKREDELSLELFESHLAMINNTADLVIIDHLHYFEFHKKEYEAINEIMKKLKKLQEKYRLPIILVSHLRKKDKTRSFPDQEDFHGSSNIVKQADTCIVMAHIDNNEDDAEKQIVNSTYKTGIRIVKSRTGFSSKLIGVLEYSLEERTYSEKYDLMVCGNNYMADVTNDNIPKWAVGARRTDAKL